MSAAARKVSQRADPDLAQLAGLDAAAEGHVAGYVAELLGGHEGDAGLLGGLEDLAAFVDRDGHQLFEQHVLAGAGGGDRKRGVGVVDGADVDGVDLGVGGELAGGVGADVTDCGEADAIRRELVDGQVGAGD